MLMGKIFFHRTRHLIRFITILTHISQEAHRAHPVNLSWFSLGDGVNSLAVMNVNLSAVH